MVSAILVYLGVSGLEGPGEVTIKEAQAPPDATGEVDPGGEKGASVREVYTHTARG